MREVINIILIFICALIAGFTISDSQSRVKYNALLVQYSNSQDVCIETILDYKKMCKNKRHGEDNE